MGWFSFGVGRRPRQRSYHSRGGVSRVLASGGGQEPTCVEDVAQDQGFWSQHRGQITGFLSMGTVGLFLVATIVWVGGGWEPDVLTVAVGVVSVLMLMAPLLFWIRYQRQRRRYETVAQDSPPYER